MFGSKAADHRALMPKSEYLPAPPEDRSGLNTDPRYQRKPQIAGGCLARMRAWGVRINEDKIQAHYDLVAAQSQRALERGTETGPQVGVAKSDLAPRVGTATKSLNPEPPRLGAAFGRTVS